MKDVYASLKKVVDDKQDEIDQKNKQEVIVGVQQWERLREKTL